VQCLAGTYATAQSISCTACASGTYANSAGASSCTDCAVIPLFGHL
jgi:hypothetical protein